MDAASGRSIAAAVLLAALALIPMIYGAVNLGVAVNVRDVAVSSSISGSPNIPRRTTWEKEYADAFTLSGLSGLAVGDKITVRFELMVDKSLSDSVRSIVAIIDLNGDGTYDLTNDVYVSLSKPWEEFTYTVEDDGTGSPVASKSWSVYVEIQTGNTAASGTFNVVGSPAAYTPAA